MGIQVASIIIKEMTELGSEMSDNSKLQHRHKFWIASVHSCGTNFFLALFTRILKNNSIWQNIPILCISYGCDYVYILWVKYF